MHVPYVGMYIHKYMFIIYVDERGKWSCEQLTMASIYLAMPICVLSTVSKI